MFSKLRNFAERHYKKFVVTGVVLGGAYVLKQYAERKFIEWQEREMDQLLERSRKQQHFESTERTCNVTVTSVMMKLEVQIGKTLDSDEITLLLKNRAPNKKELWERLKVIAFSRIVAYIYGNAMLVVLLRTQVHVLGAYLYKANRNPDDPDLELSPELQNQFLSASNHWLTTGIQQFCEFIEDLVAVQVAGVSLKDKLMLDDVEKILHDLRIVTENEISKRPAGFVTAFMFPPVEATSSPALDKLLSETRDVLESREVSELVSNCANAGVSCVLDKLAESISGLMEPTAGSSHGRSDFVHPSQASAYVAKLIPVLNNMIHSDAWLQQLLKMEPIHVFGANIYESFSN